MRRKIAAFLAGVLLFAQAASAHRIDEYLQATILSLDAHRVQASMRLIPGMLVSPSVIAAIDSNGDGVFSEGEEQTYVRLVLGDVTMTIDGQSLQPQLVSWSIPQPAQLRDGLGEIHIAYAADLPSGGEDRTLTLANHHQSRTSVYLANVLVPDDNSIDILAQKRNRQQSTFELVYRQKAFPGPISRTWWAGFRPLLNTAQLSSLFHLGMRHIAEGPDHLLFLLTLLLPAPLLAARGRWGPPAGVRQSLLRILGIVTAFTIGHSITLMLAALGAVRVPARPVEVLIALSIFVSALHALRPIVPGKEALLAAFFGLIHGLAFAATLDRLGLGRWERAGGILAFNLGAFNLGIETMQMLVVALILPSLLLMSRTRAYLVFRIAGAIFAGVASAGWMVERVFGVGAAVDTIVNALAAQGAWIALALFLVSIACQTLPASPVQQEAPAGAATALTITARSSLQEQQ